MNANTPWSGHPRRLSCEAYCGNYITAKPNPNDVDVVLVMADDFSPLLLRLEDRGIFDHQLADQQFGASIFWIRPTMLFETLTQFIQSWQTRRDGRRLGIVEVVL